MNSSREGSPLISAVLCTFNRKEYLARALESLLDQTLPQSDFEVVLVDDGSEDGTGEVAEAYAGKLPLRSFRQRNAGLSSAKNHGLFASRGEIILFCDDDDISMPSLLEEHCRSHRDYPRPGFAVLNYTGWSDDITITPLMHYVTEVGCFYMAYPTIEDGDILDYTYFWGGRSSCKRSFLIDHGIFNQVFRFGCEDIELGYRLSRCGLQVVYNRRAESAMIRPVTFDGFCRRLVSQGRSQHVFAELHDDPEVQRWAEVVGAEERWKEIRDSISVRRRAAIELDRIALAKQRYGFGLDGTTTRLLHEAYQWIFKACKIRGIMEARGIADRED